MKSDNIKEMWESDGGDGEILSVWMQDQHQGQVLLSLILMQEKAKSLYKDLKKKQNWTVFPESNEPAFTM